MGLNTSRKGSRAEHKAIASLEAEGYVCVRSSASKSPLDVVAFGSSMVRGVQVKSDSDSRPLRPSELEQAKALMRAMPQSPQVQYELWVWRNGKWRVKEIVRMQEQNDSGIVGDSFYLSTAE